MHTTTNINKPPDIGVIDDDNIIPLRTVAHAIVDLSDRSALELDAGSEVASGVNSELAVPPCRTHLFTGSTGFRARMGLVLPVASDKDSPAQRGPPRESRPFTIVCQRGLRIYHGKAQK